MEVCQGFKQRHANAVLQEKSDSQMPLQKPMDWFKEKSTGKPHI